MSQQPPLTNMNEQNGEDGRTSLIWFAIHDNAEAIELLFEKSKNWKIDSEMVDKKGYTAVTRAIRAGSVNALKTLAHV